MSEGPFRITVSLWVKPKMMFEFHKFEKRAFEIMKNFGARVVEISNPKQETPDTPFEIHIIEFPSKAKFEAYRKDERTMMLSETRNACIEKTQIEIGN